MESDPRGSVTPAFAGAIGDRRVTSRPMDTPNPLAVVRREVKDGVPVCRGIWIWCPGCDKAHRIRVPLEDGSFDAQPIWEWTGTTDETFTISPSLLIWTGDRNKPAPGDRRCHSYIKNGVWDFLTDSNHSLAGKKVPMVPVPDWIARREH